MRNSVILFVLVAIMAAGLAVPSEAQISVGGAIVSRTEKYPIAINVMMALHIVDAADEAYGPESVSRLLRAPLAAVSSGAMAGPAGKPANVPAYFRLTGQGVKDLVSLEVSFNGVDFEPCAYEGPNDGFIGVVPRLRPGLYMPVGRLIHKDGRKEATYFFFIHTGKNVEGEANAAFMLNVTNPVAGVENMGTREIAALCSNMIPSDGPQPVQVAIPVQAAVPVAPTVPATPQSQPVWAETDESDEYEEAEEETTSSTVRISVQDQVAGKWPTIKLRTPDGVFDYTPEADGEVIIVGATPGVYELLEVSGTVRYMTVPFNDPNSKKLDADNGFIEWTLRRER